MSGETPVIDALELEGGRLLNRMRVHRIPAHMHAALLRYCMKGVKPGDFLSAVIVGDLYAALNLADDININALRNYGMFFYNDTPAGCYGNAEAMARWIKLGGIQGRRAEAGQ